METGFKAITEAMTLDGSGWKVAIPSNWRQGRTIYGGLTTALALEACHRDFTDLPPLRSAGVNFIGPVTGDPVYKTTLLRRGRNVTMIEVKGYVDDKPIISVTLSFGTVRTSELSADLSAPPATTAEDCEFFTPPAMNDFVPAFFHNFDTRLIAGGRPVSGFDKGYSRTWSRHGDPASREGTSSLLCLADVLPPAAMPLMTRMGPVSSMTWMVNILTDKPVTTDGWWHVETALSAARDGYASQLMRIWNSEGELVIDGMQSVAIFM